jgi:hypothetical protein
MTYARGIDQWVVESVASRQRVSGDGLPQRWGKGDEKGALTSRGPFIGTGMEQVAVGPVHRRRRPLGRRLSGTSARASLVPGSLMSWSRSGYKCPDQYCSNGPGPIL